MTTPSSPDPVAQVTEGMVVVDASGEEIGSVEFVKMADPGAVTVSAAQDLATEPDLPGEVADRLLTVGFVKIDGKGLFARDRYVEANKIDHVSDDRVYLSVAKADVAREQ